MSLVGSPVQTKTFKPTATVEANTFVGFDDNTCAAGAPAKGISRDKTAAGQLGDAVTIGEAYVLAGAGGLAIEDAVESDAAGHGVAAGSGTKLARAKTAGDEDEMVLVMLDKG